MPNFCFLNDDLQEKRSPPSMWTKNVSIQIKNCVAALSMMASIVFGSVVRHAWPSVIYNIKKTTANFSLNGIVVTQNACFCFGKILLSVYSVSSIFFICCIYPPLESELYCYILEGTSALARELPLRGVWATCLPHKGGGVPLSVLPKDTTMNLPACSPHPPLNAERKGGSYEYHFLKSFDMARQGE